MGARHSKRSVDISAATKKDKESTSEEKLERIDDPEAAKQNGTTPRPEEPKEGSGDATTPQVNGDDKEEETKEGETAEKNEDETEKKEPQTPESPVEAEAKSPEDKSEKKKKEKKEKRKWSLRSISFTRKDKSKPNMSKDDSITNDLSKIADTVAEVVEGEKAATTEEKKETAEAPVAVEEKKEEKDAPAAPLSSVISSISSAATNAVEEVKEKVEEKKEEVKSQVVTKAEEIIEEGKAIVQKTVEQVIEKTSSVVESSSSSFTTTVVESSEVITSSSSQLIKETLEIKSDESPAPPLPASPPPTEAPPPTPNVISQPEHEDVNGGGEGMAEMPEENGLGSDKIDDDEEELVPKMNGHSDVSPVKQVENIIDAIKSEAIEKTILAENNGELVTTQEALKAAEE